ncbi:MAG TPA: cyclic nucleotide-binding domain-containing protein [Thermoanaerobaculia bacterium]|nr:cyclic nucleotide-binding domain-containing protein [Thermoanaerobaculia bacterium]
MALNWFGGKKQQQESQEYTVDDLIVLERYDEAAERLRARLKDHPNDLHSRLKLAEVHVQLRQFEKSVDEFVFVAEEYAQDGFYDKGIALLSKAMKLAPLDQSLRCKIEKLQREKSKEHVRAMALDGLRQAGGQDAGNSALEIKNLWHHLAGTTIVQRLPGDGLKRFFATTQIFRCDPATVLAKEGSQEAFLLLLVTGVVEASIASGAHQVMVRSFSSGDILGESALLERGVWPADYRAVEPVTALTLTRAGLELNLQGNSDPRGFLETLREQHNDRDVAATVRRLRSGS